jgi:uncharacterized protein YlxW (UPF0749 family)
MGQEIPQPNQVSYDFVCQQTGKLFLESQNEISRLTSMLLELQDKYAQKHAQVAKLQQELDDVKTKLIQKEMSIENK